MGGGNARLRGRATHLKHMRADDPGGVGPRGSTKLLAPEPEGAQGSQFDPFLPILARSRGVFVVRCLCRRAAQPATRGMAQTSKVGSMNEMSSSRPSRLNTAVMGLAL